MTPRRTGLAGAASLAVAGRVFAQGGDPTVTCPAGHFIGARTDGVSAFRGIRYGRAQRFRAPIAEPPQSLRATAFGPPAPQRGKRGPGSEDCLFLNVWTPDAQPDARLPVMVYFHGGAYAYGSVTDPVCDGARLAAQGVVVVTVNHRLNMLGYLYLAELDPRFPDSGNAGQLDLILALQWVCANIAAFGGDPKKVTAFGDSGGGGKLTTLLAMPAAAGLIHHAATISGQQVTVSSSDHATRRARAYLAKLGVADTDLSPLLTMPAERLIAALDTEDPLLGGPVYSGPVLDRRNVPRHPFAPDACPGSLGVPMLSGNARDETRGFVAPDAEFVRSMTWDNVTARIAAELPIDLPPQPVVAAYRRRLPAASPADVYFLATTAGRSWRPQLEVAEARARAGRPVWLYQVDFASRADPRRGAFHDIDLALVFGTYDAPGADTGNDAAVRQVSREMQERFVAFAQTGNPNAACLPHWPAYDLKRRATMIFDTHTRVENDPRRWQRELFARASYTQPGS